MDRRQLGKLSLPVLLMLSVLALPRPDGLSYEGQAMFAVLAFSIPMFLLQPIPLGLVGVLVMVLPLILGAADVGSTFSAFGNPAVFFLIGAFMISAAMEKTPLHRRISLLFLRTAGSSPRMLVLFTMLSGAFLSFLMPEHGVIVLLVPIITYVAASIGLVPLRSNLGKGMLIGAAYGCTIGSLGTPLGGARNPLTIGFLISRGIEVNFLRWMELSLPLVLLSILLVWGMLVLIFPPEMKRIKTIPQVLEDELGGLPPVTGRNLLVSLTLLLIIASFIILPSLFGVDLTLIALIGGVAIFLVGGMRWEDVESRIPWGIILLYGGAITLGVHLIESGGASFLADRIVDITGGSPFLSILLVVILTKLLTEFMSNTAAVSVLLPIGSAVFLAAGLPVEMGAMLVGLSGGLAFMFLISTPGNLISFTSGYFSQKDLLKAGLLVNLVTIAAVFLTAYTYWKLIGVW